MMLILAVLALAAAEPPPPPSDEAVNADGLQQMYDQSCAAREYGAFDDLCDQLSHRLHEARTEADRAARRKPPKRNAAAAPGVKLPAPAPAIVPPSTILPPSVPSPARSTPG